MAPEYGATMGFFPVDDRTIEYFRGTGRTEAEIEAFEAYFKAQGLFGMPKAGDIDYSQTLELDLASVMPSLAGPKRPQDRIDLERVKQTFTELYSKPVAENGFARKPEDLGKRVKTFDGIDVGSGDVLIAAITSCTNTSNPGVLLAAGLLAKKAVELGLKVKPHIKTSLAPGSRVVTEYLSKAGLLPYLEKLGFYRRRLRLHHLHRQRRPLAQSIDEAVVKNDLVCAAVLSGNRNFEARIHPNINANFLASPPLVVAYAIAGTMLKDFRTEPLGKSKDGQDVYIGHIWPSHDEIAALMKLAMDPKTFRRLYSGLGEATPLWKKISAPSGQVYTWPESTYIAAPPFFEGFEMQPGEVAKIAGAHILGGCCRRGIACSTVRPTPPPRSRPRKCSTPRAHAAVSAAHRRRRGAAARAPRARARRPRGAAHARLGRRQPRRPQRGRGAVSPRRRGHPGRPGRLRPARHRRSPARQHRRRAAGVAAPARAQSEPRRRRRLAAHAPRRRAARALAALCCNPRRVAARSGRSTPRVNPAPRTNPRRPAVARARVRVANPTRAPQSPASDRRLRAKMAPMSAPRQGVTPVSQPKVQLSLTVNGEATEVSFAPYKTLLEVLREDLGLVGTKHGCELGECGACAVLVDGKPVLSCLMLGLEAAGRSVLSIEGMADGPTLHPLQAAFADHGAAQCGYCTPAMLLTAKSLLDNTPSPTIEDIRRELSGVLCRCTGYTAIFDAVGSVCGLGPSAGADYQTGGGRPRKTGCGRAPSPVPPPKASARPCPTTTATTGPQRQKRRAPRQRQRAALRRRGRQGLSGHRQAPPAGRRPRQGHRPAALRRRPRCRPRMLHCKLLRSPHPHAHDRTRSTSRAPQAHPGVQLVLTGRDFPIPYGILPVSQDEHALAPRGCASSATPSPRWSPDRSRRAGEALRADRGRVPSRCATIADPRGGARHARAAHPRLRRGGQHPQARSSSSSATSTRRSREPTTCSRTSSSIEGNTHLPIEQHASLAPSRSRRQAAAC